MAYVEKVIKDFADFMESPEPIKVKPLKVVEPDADTVRFIKHMDRFCKGIERSYNRIIRELDEAVEREING